MRYSLPMRSCHGCSCQRHLGQAPECAKTWLSRITDYGKRIRQQRPLSYNNTCVCRFDWLAELFVDPAHHDELLFITVHQAMSFGSNNSHEIDAVISQTNENRLTAQRAHCSRGGIEKLLINQIHILKHDP